MQEIFITFIYQPFLNILVFFYWGLGQIPGFTADMGVAVILMTIVIRLLLLPVSLASDRTEHERKAIEKKAKEIQATYADDPVMMQQELKKIMRTNPRILIAEFFELFINIAITLLLIRIFGRGLEGEDLHLLYSWVPHPQTPYNLVFLGRFDLAHPNLFLNIVQSLVILLVEVAAELTSPFRNLVSVEQKPANFNAITPTTSSYAVETRSRVRSLQFVLPVVSFFVFLLLPAGKKLFIITTLLFTFLLIMIKWGRRKMQQMFPPVEEEPIQPAPEAPHSVP